jgi:GH43 family beta-xylosidase
MTSRVLALLACLAIDSSVGVPAVNESPTSTFKNPLNSAGADPWAFYSEGFYHFTRTTGSGVDIWRSRTLTGVDHGERKTVYTPEEVQKAGLKEIWAPEIHRLRRQWYVYFTGNTGCGDKCRGIYVLENASANPVQGSWTFRGRVNTGPELDDLPRQLQGGRRLRSPPQPRPDVHLEA